jgi:heptaprenyl diphosphate synthase
MAKVDGKIEEVARLAPAQMTEQLQHALEGGGKRVRPALTLLSGKFKKYNAGVLVSMAVGVELLHTATLVHDDTIDDAQLRRGKMSIKQRWGNSNAELRPLRRRDQEHPGHQALCSDSHDHLQWRD